MQTAQRRNEYIVAPAPPRKRIVKMDGNVAYINNGFARQKAQPAVAAKKQVKPKKTGVVSTLAVLFIAFCAMAALVSRYAIVCSVGAGNNAIEKDITALEAQIDKLEVDLELRDNIEYIQDTAEQELGMVYPQPDQRISIDSSS